MSFEFYSKETLKLMASIESEHKDKMFHELFPEIEKQFWKAYDSRSVNKIRTIHARLCKELDKLRMD